MRLQPRNNVVEHLLLLRLEVEHVKKVGVLFEGFVLARGALDKAARGGLARAPVAAAVQDEHGSLHLFVPLREHSEPLQNLVPRARAGVADEVERILRVLAHHLKVARHVLHAHSRDDAHHRCEQRQQRSERRLDAQHQRPLHVQSRGGDDDTAPAGLVEEQAVDTEEAAEADAHEEGGQARVLLAHVLSERPHVRHHAFEDYVAALFQVHLGFAVSDLVPSMHDHTNAH
mmetsp:Transcript_22988/g.74911  ORF Transcript_22988/g.74911 Transcript_22988/m.74911 type:complete len:230 (+) Transcript_22988:64-753(+)